MEFTAFERDLIEWFLSHAECPSMAAQLKVALPCARDFTGAGMFLSLSVPRDAPVAPTALTSPVDGPQIESPSIPNGAGCLLFLKDGIASQVEVYTYTAEFFNEHPSFRLLDQVAVLGGQSMAKWDPRLTALIRAAVENPALARELVEADPSILELRTGLGETALHYLAVEDYGGAVQVLIDLGASIDVTNKFGATPLEEAESINAADAAEVLRRAGAQ